MGYSVRFTDQVSDTTLVKVMTDGILLAEIQRDSSLLRYDTLIIDEAHERSLNIDFLLGYLGVLLPRRPDLKVIITSATIDPQRFADHFGGAPVVEVSGRTYPVELRYQPLDGDVGEPRDQTEGIVDAVRELSAEPVGDILVFLTGEREIRDTAETLRGLELPNTEVLPLYARLAAAEQHRVWQPHSTRRIVLATNVAETSLTVPGIRYVVDPGLARISRFSKRTKVQRLPIEAISQASASQRAGRCGRTSDGICVRLYSEADFAARPEFTEPEILRTNLASVILQMTALGLGDLEQFGFLDPPDSRSIRDGVALLQELGALESGRGLTQLGRQLSQLPVDPRLGRMIIEAGRLGCVREVLVLAAVLSIPDPRERPMEHRPGADALHARFADEHSDFTALLNLWTYLREQQRERSGNQFRRMCRDEFLHYLRIREWQDMRAQLRQIAGPMGLTESTQPADPQVVHAAVLSGLLSHVGLRVAETREYQGARNVRFVIAPGSSLAKKPPRWVVAAELVETSRLLARVVARVEPDAVERLAAHLVLRSYSEPHWDRRRGAVMAYERVTLYGLPLVAHRRVNYAGVDPVVSRELFVRHALVQGEWDTRHQFLHDNRAMLAELGELEERTRRRDLIVGEDDLVEFYEQRLPADVVSARHFDSWWKKAGRETPELLTFTREDVVASDARETLAAQHPEVWRAGDLELPIRYRFAPGAEDDGVTVHIPLDTLGRLGGAEFGWQVPALREELVIALIRSLPKTLRRHFVPVPDTARAVLAGLTPGQEPVLDGLQRELHRLTGVLVPRAEFDLDRLPPHLRIGFAVVGPGQQVMARGHDLGALQAQLAEPLRQAVASAVAPELERDGLHDWPADLAGLPRAVEQARSGHVVRGYPALVDGGPVDDEGGVAIRVFATESEQASAMSSGTRRLLRLALGTPARTATAGLSTRARLVLGVNPDGGLAELVADCADAAVDQLVAAAGGPAWDAEGFAVLREHIRAVLPEAIRRILLDVEQALGAAHDVRAALSDRPPAALAPAVADIRAQFRALLPRGFVTANGAARLRDITRYLKAMSRRLDRLPRDVDLDSALMLRIAQVQQAYDDVRLALPAARASAADVARIFWDLQELRVSLFAQQLGTPRPVSEQRIYRAIDAITP